MIQVFFSSLSGIIIHKKNKFIHYPSLLFIGIPAGVFALTGSYFSQHLNSRHILVLFALIILTAFLLLLFNKNHTAMTDASDIKADKKLSVLIGISIGLVSGIVGAGGGFILIPVMTKILKIPLKITIGTSLGIVFIGAVFGSIGKIISLQVDFSLLLPIIAGSLLSARAGAKVSKKTSPSVLRIILLFAITFSFIQVMIKILAPYIVLP